MAKKGQEATWENDHFKGPKKPRAAKVPHLTKGKGVKSVKN